MIDFVRNIAWAFFLGFSLVWVGHGVDSVEFWIIDIGVIALVAIRK